jgi:hypothetical protein
MKYLVFESETDIDQALTILASKYKFQRLDGKWITNRPETIPTGLPVYSEEEEDLSWYSINTKQYDVLYRTIIFRLNTKYDIIDRVYEEVRRNFTNENILMGITELGQTQIVLDAMEKVDYCMRSRSVVAVFDLIDAIPRSEPFLTDARLNSFKNELLSKLNAEGVL